MDKYKAVYQNLIKYEEEKHKSNKHKIKVALKLYIIIPLIFLIISFFKTDGKLVFLVLWIASLFILSVYMIYIEYSDHNLQKKIREFGRIMEEEPSEETAPLLEGKVAEKMEGHMNSMNEAIDDLISRYGKSGIDR